MRGALVALASALVAALVLPLLFVLTESAVLQAPVGADDFPFAYQLAAPFALLVSLLVAWPTFALAPVRWPSGRRIVLAAFACVTMPIALIGLLEGEFAWKGGLAGLATCLLWVGARRVIGTFDISPKPIRSEPSG